MESFDLLKLPWLGLGLGLSFFRGNWVKVLNPWPNLAQRWKVSTGSSYAKTPSRFMSRVLHEILAMRATLESGHQCPESIRQSDFDDSFWTVHHRHMVYIRLNFFWLDCAFLHLNFRVWNFRWKGISFKLKNFQVQKKRDLKQSVSVTNAGTVAQSDSLGTFDKMHSDQFYVWVMLDSCSIQSH